MGSALINLSAVIDVVGGTQPASLQFTAQVMRGGQPALRAAGAIATLPALLTVYWNGAAWTPAQPQLTDIDLDCYWLVELAKPDRSVRLQRAVVLPTGHGSTVNFGDLVTVDPATLQPSPTTLQTWLAAAEPAGLSPSTQASLAATYPAFRATAPTSTQVAAGVVAYIDTTTVPPTLKGWNGTGWVAIGGSGGGSAGAVTHTDNGDGFFTVTGTGVVDNGDGFLTLTDSTVVDNGDGFLTLAA